MLAFVEASCSELHPPSRDSEWSYALVNSWLRDINAFSAAQINNNVLRAIRRTASHVSTFRNQGLGHH